MTAKRLVRQNRAGLGISSANLSNFRSPSGEFITQTAKSSPLWQLINKELPSFWLISQTIQNIAKSKPYWGTPC